MDGGHEGENELTDELRKRRWSRPRRRTFEQVLSEGVRWPFQTALEFPEVPPAMPKMVSSRRPQGDVVFQSKKMLRPVRCESGVEKAFFSKLDELTEVLWFHEQAEQVRYSFHGKVRRYHPDALVALGNGHLFVVEVKDARELAAYQTICKVNALIEWAHACGRGVFLGNDSSTVGDFIGMDVPRRLRDAVLTACSRPSGMSRDEWKRIAQTSQRDYSLPPSWLQALVLDERLVLTKPPFNVRLAKPAEEREIDLFVRRFETTADVLPLSAARRQTTVDGATAEEG
jgi:hypothetical protein